MTIPASVTREQGHSTSVGGLFGGGALGYPDDPAEQNLDLVWPLSVRVYDRMRRDGKLSAVLRSWIHPICGANWSLDPNGARDEIVHHVAEDLGLPILGDDAAGPAKRTRGRFSWSEHVRLAVGSSLTYGHMGFEQVYDDVALKATGKARLKKLAPRMPQTIEQINVERDGGLKSIVQHPSGLVGDLFRPEPISVDRLVWYANDREGGAWQGQSLLRNAYAAWYLKQDGLRTHAVSIRRNGMGVPVGEAPLGASQEQINELARTAMAFRGGEKAGGAVPHGGRIRLLGVEGSLPDTLGWLKYLDEEMAGSALAEFLKLGSSASGSRALGDTFLDVFELATNATATDLVADTATAHVVEDIVDLNYGPDELAPRIVHERIDANQQGMVTAIQNLVSTGALTMDDELEQYLRDSLRLPRRKTPRPIAPAKPVQPAAARDQKVTPVASVQPKAATRRDPQPHEEHVDFDALDAAWTQRIEELLPAWKGMRDGMLLDLLDQVSLALDAGDLAGLGSLNPTTGEGARLLEAAMTTLAETATAEAVAEAARQGVAVEAPELDLDSLAVRAQLVDELLANSLTDLTARQALLRWVEGVPTEEVTAAITDHVAGLTDNYLVDQLGGALTAAQNQARFAVMSNGNVAAVYASELLDTATCVACADKDGQEYTSVAAGARDYPTGGYKDCLGGTRCRGTLVAVYASESTPST